MNNRFEIFENVMSTVDETFELLSLYDDMPRKYGNEIMYQAESHILQRIGQNPNITIKKLSEITQTTPSYCSQTVKKMREKGFVQQTRNENNNREYYLNLTEAGKIVFDIHEAFDNECYHRNCSTLDQFTNEELVLFSKILGCLNTAFEMNIKRSKEELGL